MPTLVEQVRPNSRLTTSVTKRTARETSAEPEYVAREDLIAAAYNGMMEKPPWQTLTELLRQRLEAQCVILVLRPPSQDNSGLMVYCGANDLAAKESYERHFFALDPFVCLDEGKVITVEELIGHDEWLRSAIYLQYLRHIDVRHILGADIRAQNGVECRLRVTRSHRATPFNSDAKVLLQFLLPHLKNAMQLRSRIESLERERQIFAGTVNRMLLGMISLAQNGNVIEINQEARRILSQNDGLGLMGNYLFIESSQERREFQRMLQLALATPEQKGGNEVQAMPITCPSGRGQLGILIRQFSRDGAWLENRMRPAAIVYIRDPERGTPQPSYELVRRLFGLTRVEAQLALLLAEGLTLDEASERMKARRNTARTHLRGIFVKTGVRRQTLLVKLLLNSVATLG
jgi:DNA-binding CsgD family transcriptional regulator/PAS domain-containing protein